jgi:predicted metallopeptidase
MKEKVTSVSTDKSVSVYIDEILHLHINKSNLNGLHSYIEEKKDNNEMYRCKYYIQIVFNNGNDILAEYETKELWVEILRTLSKLID